MLDIDEFELDQGQYDGREDVLSVGIAGALIRKSTFEELGGLDPYLGPFGDGLELGRRVRLAGLRVVVEPKAIVFHKQAGLHGMRGKGGGRPTRSEMTRAGFSGSLVADDNRSFRARRTAQIYNWLLAVPLWQLPFTYLLLCILGVLRSVVRLARKTPRLAAFELRALWSVIARPWVVFSGRRRIAACAVLPRSVLRPLETTHREIEAAKRTLKRVHAEVNDPLLRDEAAQSDLHARLSVERTVHWVIVVLLAFLSAISFRSILTGAVGGALPALDTDFNTFFASVLSGWIPSGDGYAGGIGGFDLFTALLVVLTLPFNLAGIDPNVVVGFFLVLSLPAAWMSMWWATSAFTYRMSLRLWSSLFWALSPALLVSVAHGHLGAVVITVIAPAGLGALIKGQGLGIGRILKGDNGPIVLQHNRVSIPLLALASTILLVITSSLVACGLFLCLVLIVGAIKATTLRRYVPLLVLPSVVAASPVVYRAFSGRHFGAWRELFAQVELPYKEQLPSAWQLASGLPTPPHTLLSNSFGLAALSWIQELLWLIPGWIVVGAAVLAMFRWSTAVWPVRVAWLVSIGALFGALASTHIPVSLAHTHVVTSWPAPWLALWWLGLLSAALLGWGPMVPDEDRNPGAQELMIRSVSKILGVASIALAVVSGAVLTIGTSPGFLVLETREAQSVAAIVRNSQQGDYAQRTLAITVDEKATGGDLVEAQVWRGPGMTAVDVSRQLSIRRLATGEGRLEVDPTTQELQSIVGALVSRSSSLALLGRHAIGLVILPGVDGSGGVELVNALDANPDLEKIGVTASGMLWRVIPEAQSAHVSQAPGQWSKGVTSWPHDGKGVKALAGGPGMDIALENRPTSTLLSVAERPDPHWSATLDGKPLEAISPQGALQTFKVPAGAGVLHISYLAFGHWMWLGTFLLALTVLFFAILPLRRSQEIEA